MRSRFFAGSIKGAIALPSSSYLPEMMRVGEDGFVVASTLTTTCRLMFMFSKIAKATEAAAIANAKEPRAESAYYDLSSDRIVINLKSGATYSFPPKIAQGLTGASPKDLAEVEVTPSGDGLHWEKLDADFSVPALLAGLFGTDAWMAQIRLLADMNISPKRSRSCSSGAIALFKSLSNLSKYSYANCTQKGWLCRPHLL